MLLEILCTARGGPDAIVLEYDSLAELSHATIADQVRREGHLVMRPRTPMSEPPWAEILAALGLDAVEDYASGSVVREAIAPGFLSTDQVAPRLHVVPHNEMAYTPAPPELACFVCVQPPTSGGATSIFDGERALEQLERIEPTLARRVVEHDLVWTRRLWPEGSRGTSSASSWARVLGVSSFDEAPARARALGYRVVEVDDEREILTITHARRPVRGDCLVTSLIDQHPITYATIYEGHFPTIHETIDWDDGTPVSEHELLSFARAFVAARRPFSWTRTGELVVLDNLRFAHGRDPYSGIRQIAVTLGMAGWLRAGKGRA